MPYAEIELALHPLGQSLYQVGLRVTDPTSEGVIQPAFGKATLTTEALEDFESKPAQYGQLLSGLLFKDPEIREAWLSARSALQKSNLDIRLRLLLTPGDVLLHSFRWELLTDPKSNIPIATSKEILFSRFLFSRDWRNIKLQPKGNLEALIAIAAPSDLNQKYNLAPILPDLESAPVVAAMQPLLPQVIAQPLTLDALKRALDSSPDILYLVCHGTILDGDEPLLFLCDAEGNTALTPAKKLTDHIARLDSPPRLVVLASCQSAGFADSAQSSLATLLSIAGVPAVIAMQGNVSMKSVHQAIPRFFEELFKDGQIDRALATARFEVRDNPDAWMPALLLRLKSGRIWYDPGFKTAKGTPDFWNEICLQVRRGTALPIVGPDLAEATLGSSGNIALALAEAQGFPLSPADRTDLAKVAQYLSITKGIESTRVEVQKQLMQRAKASFPSTAAKDNLSDILQDIAGSQRQDPTASMTILANLNLPAYVNASSNSFLLNALLSANKNPIDVFSKWRPSPGNPSPMPPIIDDSEISPATPLHYAIFGDCDFPEHWVLTEDDFFDFTVRASEYKLIPALVRRLLCQSSLLFLGFSLDSWIFRALFRMIVLHEGIAAFQHGKTHIGVQLDPEDSRFSDPEGARQYLIKYFNSARRGSVGEPQIDVYWGSSTDFLRELSSELDKRKNDHLPTISSRGRNVRS